MRELHRLLILTPTPTPTTNGNILPPLLELKDRCSYSLVTLRPHKNFFFSVDRTETVQFKEYPSSGPLEVKKDIHGCLYFTRFLERCNPDKPIGEHVSMGPFHHRKVKLCLPQRLYDLKETEQGDGGSTGGYLGMGKRKHTP